MTDHIAFSCNGFPIASETFIAKQIYNAFSNGYELSVHCQFANTSEDSTIHSEMVNYLLTSSVFSLSNWPEKINLRIVRAMEIVRSHHKLPALLKSINPVKFGRSGLSLRIFRDSSTFIKSGQPDLVHAHYGPNGVKAIIARQLGIIHCPIITTFHGYDAHSTPQNHATLAARYRDLFIEGDRFIVNGEFLKKQLLGLGCPEEKVSIIENSIDTNFFSGESIRSLEKIRLITVGRLVDWKNQALGIKCLKYLLDQGVDATYAIVGEGREKPRLTALTASLGIADRVHFLGNLTQEGIKDQFLQSNIFLMTSIPGPDNRQETQGIVTLEAQAASLPVVAIDNGGIASTIVDNVTGKIVPIGNEQAYLDAVLVLAKDHEKCKAFGLSGTKFVREKFDDSIKLCNILELYRGLIR